MIEYINASSFFAEQSPLTHLGRNLRGEDGGTGGLLLAIALLALVVIFVGGGVTWLRRRYRNRSPRALFNDLCRAHQLDRHDRHALARLARENGLSHPACAFVAPQLFEKQELEQLRLRLFNRPSEVGHPNAGRSHFAQ